MLMCTLGVTTYSVTRDRPLFRRMTRLWANGLARGWGMNVVAHGHEHLRPGGPYVFVANHLSHVDIVALFVALPIDVGFLAKKELRMVPFLGQAMIAGGHVFVDRKKHTSALQAMNAAAAEVRAGASLVIFPEGTRGMRDEIQPFKKGGFHLARAAGVPVVPVGLRGTRAILGRDRYTIRPGTVHVHIGRPIACDAFVDARALSDAVRRETGALADMPLVAAAGREERAEYASD